MRLALLLMLLLTRATAQQVTALVRDNENSMKPLFKSSVVRQAMEQGTQEQTRAMLGMGADAPVFTGGLVPSDDGLQWAVPESD